MHCALLLAVALQLEPSPPVQGEAATLTVTTSGETGPLRVDIGGAAMLRGVPDGADVQRAEADLQLRWQRAPERARVELVFRADEAAGSLKVTALAGTSTATLGVEPLRRDAPPASEDHSVLIVLAGLALSLLMWPTFRLNWRLSKIAGLLVAVVGTAGSIFFVRLWWRDIAATPHIREGRCVVTDRMMVYEGRRKAKRFYSLMYAVQLDGRPLISGDGDRSDWSYIKNPGERLQRFEIGKAYPCWWSVRDRQEVLLEPRRRAITQMVILTVAAFLLLITPGWMARPGPRHRRRKR